MFEHLIGVKGGIPGVKKGKNGFGDQPPGHKQFLKNGFCNTVIEPMWPHIHIYGPVLKILPKLVLHPYKSSV